MRALLTALVMAVAVVIPVSPAFGQETVAVSTLLAEADAFDQQVVTIRGEIVGDYGDRGDSVWVQVNDDAYVERPLATSGRLAGTNVGISVKLPGGIAAGFGPPGGHGARGPIVAVTGVFRDFDPALGGLTFIEAIDVELISESQRLPEPGLDTTALVLGATLTAAGLLTLAHRRDLLRRRTRS